MNIKTALHTATHTLAALDTPALDAAILLAFVLHVDRLTLLLWHERLLTTPQATHFESLIAQRAQGVPIAYLTGRKAFWSFELTVNEHTLIPRPETELLVETALQLFPRNTTLSAADLGTGTGAIAIALASERPAWHITATDISEEALAVARNNAKQQQQHITFLKSHWFSTLTGKKFHLIVSNPPYLAETDPHLATNIRYEPYQALVSDATGFASLAEIIAKATQHLYPQGWLLLEHGYQQAADVRDCFAAHHYHHIQSRQDLAGHYRITFARNNRKA